MLWNELQHELRLETRGLRGIEMGFDNPGRNSSCTVESICRRGARHEVATLWIQAGMPETRPEITTGLVYGCECPGAVRNGAGRF
jgi:hypothetical protein